MQAMPKGHPLPFRLLSACFGKRGASSTVARSLSPRSAKGGTAASPLYGSFSAFLGLGSDSRGLILVLYSDYCILVRYSTVVWQFPHSKGGIFILYEYHEYCTRKDFS